MNTYLLFKSLHLISVISWMAGLLYLPRIFVYHSQNNTQPVISAVFKVMERKLFFYKIQRAKHYARFKIKQYQNMKLKQYNVKK